MCYIIYVIIFFCLRIRIKYNYSIIIFIIYIFVEIEDFYFYRNRKKFHVQIYLPKGGKVTRFFTIYIYLYIILYMLKLFKLMKLFFFYIRTSKNCDLSIQYMINYE